MTDDPFLAPPPQAGQPSEPTQADAPMPYQPAPYQPPQQVPQSPSPAEPPSQQYPPPYAATPYAATPYAPQGYPPPMPYPGQSKPKTWMNWAAFGCGLGALVTCVSFIPAIVFGHMGLAAAKRGEADQRGVGIAGLVLGYFFLAVALGYVGIIVWAASSGDL